VNFAVDDLEHHVTDLARSGLLPGEIETVNKGVKLCLITDPDRNRITLIGNFRINY
jgi:glyoxylase I family protein